MGKTLLFILLFSLFIFPVSAEDTIYGIAGGISPRGQEQIHSLLPEFDFSALAQSFSEGKSENLLKSLWENVITFLFREASLSLGVPFVAAAVAVFCNLLGNLSEGQMAEITFLIAYTASIGLALARAGEAAELARGFAEDMSLFNNVALPSLAVLSVGSVGAAMVHPLLLVASAAASLLLARVGIPALYLSLSLSVIAGLTSHAFLRTLAVLIRKCAFFIVSGSLTVFGIIISIAGYAAGTVGTAGTKGIKLAISTLVPALGGILGDAAEAVGYSAMVVKNAAGGAGMLFLLLLTLYPVLKTAVYAFLYRIAAALSTFGKEKRIGTALTDMADMLLALAGMTGAAGILSILSMGMLLKTGDMAVMLR